MGESPREEASRGFADLVKNMVSGRGQYGMTAAKAQFGEVSPYFQQGRADVNTGIDRAIGNLNMGLSNRLAGIGQTLGEQLVSSGVPAGQGRGTDFAASYAPAIAGTQEAIGGLEANRGSLLAELARTQGLTLADLMRTSDAMVNQLLQLQLSGIGGMKSSTVTGDILGIANTIGSIIAGVPGMDKVLAGLFRNTTGNQSGHVEGGI